tara:strand:- start:162 stop:617 length:456 start_codon:yes stop_codon:yes gene_type:complete
MITIQELKKKIDNKSRLLGLDLGSKRIGVSICDENRKIATPFKTFDFLNLENFIVNIKQVITENNIKGLIIGNPLNMDGRENKATQSVRDRAKIISYKTNLPVVLWDERLSTVGSFNLSSQLDVNVNKRTKNIDAKAATFILQGAIDYLNN